VSWRREAATATTTVKDEMHPAAPDTRGMRAFYSRATSRRQALAVLHLLLLLLPVAAVRRRRRDGMVQGPR